MYTESLIYTLKGRNMEKNKNALITSVIHSSVKQKQSKTNNHSWLRFGFEIPGAQEELHYSGSVICPVKALMKSSTTFK